MKINYNIPALKIINILNKANTAQSNSMQRLSSGLQIASSKDDPAGMSISLKMRAQIESLAQANKNSADAIAMIQTTEGALDTAHNITQRIRELAVQTANETYTESDRAKAQIEVDELIIELNRISEETTFNTHTILAGDHELGDSGFNIVQTATYDGYPAKYAVNLVSPKSGDEFTADGQLFKFYDSAASELPHPDPTISLDLSGDWKTDMTNADLPNFYIDPTGSELILSEKIPNQTNNVNPFDVDKLGTIISQRQISLGVSSKQYAEYEITLPSINSQFTNPSLTDPNPSSYEPGTGFTIDGIVFEFFDPADYDNGEYDGAGVGIPIIKEDGSLFIDSDLTLVIQEQAENFKNFTLEPITGTPIILRAKNPGIVGDYLAGSDGGVVACKQVIQTGSEANQLSRIDIASSSPDNLGLVSKVKIYDPLLDATNPPPVPNRGFTQYTIIDDNPLTANINEARYGLSLLSIEDSQFALGAIDRAIDVISSQRAYLGANQNRLEHTVKNLDITSENLDSARSRIQDTDMAKEMAIFTKDNILSQAANAMLAQANQRPQQIFQLLQN
ncbi:MAG: hypothetical protein ATN31_05480 [Candidatus Epulonipiscioides saccharophilum]|nr:MAG: hypothetical protein ATN31_05480 [Epulopiscium sp. AS2M-Bin001]